jgi:dihydropteroate synthase-like protein
MAQYLFLTGQIAAPSLRSQLEGMEPHFGYKVHVLPITVAALAECDWISRHLPDLRGFDAVYIPGLCQGPISVLQERAGDVPVKRGPDHLKDLPAFFELEGQRVSLEGYDITIVAEIVDAHLLSEGELIASAVRYRDEGADIIDLGGPVAGEFPGVAEKVNILRGEGFRVSVDTFDPGSLRSGAKAGAELLLSVNGSNLESVLDLGCRVVVIPDFNDRSLDSLERNIEVLENSGVPYLADPVLDPFPFGLVESLERFILFRRRNPDRPMLMGTGNQTELMEADSSGISAMMAALCSELSIGTVLTTSVASWAAGAVAEFDRARRLMFWARESRVLPKHAKAGLVALRDLPHQEYSTQELEEMKKTVRDRNYRIFLSSPGIVIFNRDTYATGRSAKEVWDKLDIVDAAHAFYIGRELERAETAMMLGKRYVQDQPLDWGYISLP